jgi:hypothetical protein
LLLRDDYDPMPMQKVDVQNVYEHSSTKPTWSLALQALNS